MAAPFHILRVAIVLFGVGWRPQGSDAEENQSARRQRCAELQEDYDRQHAAFVKIANAIKTKDDAARASSLRPSHAEFRKKFLALVHERADDDVACDALVWIASHARPEAELDPIIDLIENNHLTSPKLATVVVHLGGSDYPRGTSLVQKLVRHGGTREVRGLALWFTTLVRYARYCEAVASNIWPDAPLVRELRAHEMAAIEKRLEEIVESYGDVRLMNRKLRQCATAKLHEIRDLQPGKPAPATAGVGVDGRKMSLADQRGKVVMLVFWSSSCGPCMAEVPHLRELMRTYAGRPFAIVGVNCGDSKEQAARTMAQVKMNWPSFLEVDEGPIAQAWSIDGIPDAYLIDARGLIRSRILDRDLFAGDIDAAVREAEGK